MVVFDVNETLTDPAWLRARLDAAGAHPDLVETWLAATLRDGIALTAAGGFATFSEVAAAALSRLAPDADAKAAAEGLSDPQPRDDVAPGLRSLADIGVRIITLSNGRPQTAETVLERAGAAAFVERTLSVEAVTRWKPAPEPYLYACEQCEVAPDEALLVSVHPWDVSGALRAGLRACFVDREGRGYPGYLERPGITIGSLTELANRLA